MARPGERTPAILVGLGFASAIVLAAILLKRFHSRGRNREGQASSSDHTALPAECALKVIASADTKWRMLHYREAGPTYPQHVISASETLRAKDGVKGNSSPFKQEDDLTKVSETAERFDEAREAVEVAAKSLSSTSLLQLYAGSVALAAGLFKQATQGDCNQKEPSAFSLQNHSKWAAWNAHKGLSSDEAKAKYVRLALQLGLIRPPGEAQGSAGRAGGRRGSACVERVRFQLGPVHSRPTLTTEDGNIAGSKGDRFCCMVAKGNVDAVQRALTEDPSLVYATGEGGMTGLHFAADRGHADIARMLLAQGADVNLQDDCGETPLHVAIAAEQEELISMLVEAGTDTSLKNSEGKSCAELLEEEEELRFAAEFPGVSPHMKSAAGIRFHRVCSFSCLRKRNSAALGWDLVTGVGSCSAIEEYTGVMYIK